VLDASAIRILKMLFGKSAATRQNKKNQHNVYARILVRGTGIPFVRRCKQRLQGRFRLKHFAQQLVTKGNLPASRYHSPQQRPSDEVYAQQSKPIAVNNASP